MQTLCLWISSLASPPGALTLGTCKVYLSAVVTRHTELGYDHPLVGAPPMLSRIMAGIKRMAAQPSRPKLPITTALLEEMRPHLCLQRRSDILLWAMMWTATAGLLRISEFATRGDADTTRVLGLQQLTFHDHGQRPYDLIDASSSGEEMVYAILRLTASKTDPFRAGVDIVLSAPTALQALLAYGTQLALNGTPATPLFHQPDRTAVTRAWLMKRVDELLRKIGRDPRQYQQPQLSQRRCCLAAIARRGGFACTTTRTLEVGRLQPLRQRPFLRHPHRHQRQAVNWLKAPPFHTTGHRPDASGAPLY